MASKVAGTAAEGCSPELFRPLQTLGMLILLSLKIQIDKEEQAPETRLFACVQHCPAFCNYRDWS